MWLLATNENSKITDKVDNMIQKQNDVELCPRIFKRHNT